MERNYWEDERNLNQEKPMKLYTGIDHHKPYSVLYTVDEQGNCIREGRVNNNRIEELRHYFADLQEPGEVVLEACWSWTKLYDRLEAIGGFDRIVLAHPYKTRLIADGQIKTDRLDAKGLATLLRGNLVAKAHIPSQEAREQKRGQTLLLTTNL